MQLSSHITNSILVQLSINFSLLLPPMDVVRFINIKNQNFPQSSYSIRIIMMVQGCYKYSINLKILLSCILRFFIGLVSIELRKIGSRKWFVESIDSLFKVIMANMCKYANRLVVSIQFSFLICIIYYRLTIFEAELMCDVTRCCDLNTKIQFVVDQLVYS